MLNNKPIRNIAPDDYTYGCRSAIQKAIRRGDLDLCKTAFDELWRDKTQKQWLLWRLPILIEEEAWHLLGEAADVDATNEAEARKLLYTACLATKSKDTIGLVILGNRVLPNMEKCVADPNHPELTWACKLLRQLQSTDPTNMIGFVNSYCEDNFSLTEYQRKAMSYAADRIPKGGMLGDRRRLLIAMYLIAKRGVDRGAIIADNKKRIDAWKKKYKRKPKRVDLPWYLFDMHTQAGKIALGIFMRNHADKHAGLDKDTFERVWFGHSSGKMNKELLNLKRSDNVAPTCFDSIFYIPFVKYFTQWEGKTPKEVAQIWRFTLKESIKGCVDWIINKRAEK